MCILRGSHFIWPQVFSPQSGGRLEIQEKGPIPKWQGHDEVEYYPACTKELAQWIEDWEEMDRQGIWDKAIMGYGGPI